MNTTRTRLPPWLKVRAPWGEDYTRLKHLMRGLELHTVCEEAMCPNIGECWGAGTATFLILGDTCTRNCGFCNVKTGRPRPLDPQEPERVARAVAHMKLKHAVVTSVNRDELPDGGAHIFAQTIRRIRELVPDCTVEVLIPDFKGSPAALATVMAARPDILNHNVETVPRLYPRARPQADYRQSLDVLRQARELGGEVVTKSGMMVGLGEEGEEILEVMADLQAVDCDVLTIGQYLRPSAQHLPVERYYTPQEFDQLRAEGERLGFKHVESGPLVRSSYHAEQHVRVRRQSRWAQQQH
jgi:lipoic acid synthetase